MRCLVMVTAGAIVENTAQQSVALVEPGDSRIDGGVTFYKDDIYIYCRTSGGCLGLEGGLLHEQQVWRTR